MTSLYSGLNESEFRSAVDMQNRLIHFTMNGRFPMTKGICCKCQEIYQGWSIDHAIRCGEVLACEKCGGPILPENEALEEAEIVGVL